MTGSTVSPSQDFFGSRLQYLPIGEQKNRIQVPLYSGLIVETLPAFVEWNAPIQSDDIGSGFFHCGQKRGTIRAEVDDRYARFLQPLHHACDMRQNVAAIVFRAQATDPAVEN